MPPPTPHPDPLGVADDGGDLKYVDDEVENICRDYFATDGRVLRTGEGSHLLAETGHIDLFHLACHAKVVALVVAFTPGQ
jgi:hypothetical protein